MALPDRPSLEYLKKLAKERLPELRRTDPRARLADAQLAVAREHGFTSWRTLRAELDRRRAPAAPDRVTELFAAIRAGEQATVDRVLTGYPALANARDEEGSTPLSAAVDAHRAGLIPLLLRHGGDPHLVYAHSAHTPLSWAVVIEAYDCARALMQAGVEPDLFCAAGLGEVDRVRAFFGPDGRLRPRASATGSSRYAPDGTRLPCPPGSDARWCRTRSTWRAAQVTRARCASSSRMGPISPSRPSRARPRCTGPTSRAHCAWWRSSWHRGRMPRSAIPC